MRRESKLYLKIHVIVTNYRIPKSCQYTLGHLMTVAMLRFAEDRLRIVVRVRSGVIKCKINIKGHTSAKMIELVKPSNIHC